MTLSLYYRLHWQLIRVLQMFVEHIVLKHEEMKIYARRLEMVMPKWTSVTSYTELDDFLLFSQFLRRDPDFLKASTIDNVKKLLNSMDNELEKKKFR